jgi:DNA-binding CsgD family transcriptional regulator
MAVLRAAIAAIRPVMTEMTNYRKDGSAFRNAVMIAPVFDDQGRLAWYIGSQMDVSDGPAREERARREKAEARLAALTRRQRQVLHHMALGLRNKQIAAEIGINEKTVKMHRAALARAARRGDVRRCGAPVGGSRALAAFHARSRRRRAASAARNVALSSLSSLGTPNFGT